MSCGTKDISPRFQCPRCGSPVEDLIDGICPACFLSTREVLRVSPFQITVCTRCLKYRHENSWKEGGADLRSTIIKAAEGELPRRVKLTDKLTGGFPQGLGKGQRPALLRLWVERPSILKRKVALDICGEVGPVGSGGGAARVCVPSTVPFERMTCRACGLKVSEFYSCALQVRAEGRELDGEELEWITSLVKEGSGARARDPMAFISKIEDTKHGRDFYLGSVKRARDIAREVVHHRGGILEESKKLVGVERGSNRKLYKFTILIRLPRLQPGDVTERNGRIYLVQHFQGTKAVLTGLDGRMVCVDGAAARDLPVLARERDLGDALVLEVRPDGIQILDPRSNLTFDSAQRPARAQVGSTVRVMWVDGVPRLVPAAAVVDKCQTK